MRGSDPDAALYYMMRMVEAGDDPLFILRRMLIFASEDIGNADPRALTVAAAADEAFRRMGMPEGIFPMAHACLYLASAPKSDGVKSAIGKVSEAIRAHGALPGADEAAQRRHRPHAPRGLRRGLPLCPRLRRARGARAKRICPTRSAGARFYEPSEEGLEKAIKERLQRASAVRTTSRHPKAGERALDFPGRVRVALLAAPLRVPRRAILLRRHAGPPR